MREREREIGRGSKREREHMFPKVGLLEETRGGGKEEKNDRVNYRETHPICVGTRHNKTH
jgi:hypothetical protein